MTSTVRRTCREIGERDSRRPAEFPSRPVEDWKDETAYVLLGPPGSGKTKIFKHLAERQGGRWVTARDFLTFDDRVEWRDTTLFIDGLDETRAGSTDGRTPLDSIRAKLDRMGRPRFRLSCREADWFGANDRDHLKQVSPQRSRQGAPPRSLVRSRCPPNSARYSWNRRSRGFCRGSPGEGPPWIAGQSTEPGKCSQLRSKPPGSGPRPGLRHSTWHVEPCLQSTMTNIA